MGASSGVGPAAAAFYLPRYVITAGEYRKALGTFHATGIEEKRVPAYDEDEVTMAVEAGHRAIDAAPRGPRRVGAWCPASGSRARHPTPLRSWTRSDARNRERGSRRTRSCSTSSTGPRAASTCGAHSTGGH